MKCICGRELKVMQSPAGFYIGTEAVVDEGFPDFLAPYCRFSDYMNERQAEEVLQSKSLLWAHDRFSDEQYVCAGGQCLDYSDIEDI